MNIITLINAINVLNQFTQTKISVMLAYKIMKFYKNAETEKDFYEKKKSEIINTYAARDNDGNIIITDNGMISIMPDKVDEANAALKELNNVKIEIPNLKFRLSELSELKLSVADMFVLEEFIDVE